MSKKIIVAGILALVVIGGIVYGVFLFSQKDFFGWRLNFGVDKIETNDYTGIGPDINFKYPKIFEIDSDQDKKYGKSYVVGLKLRTDNRTGCDVRTGGPELDLSKDAQTIADGIVGPIREKAKDFNLLEKSKVKIGGQDAFKVSFSFLDPIGARVRLDQIFVKNDGGNLIIICGTGEYQYGFFRKDFQLFYSSINFKNKLTNQN